MALLWCGKKEFLVKNSMTQLPYRNMGTLYNSFLTVFSRHIFSIHKEVEATCKEFFIKKKKKNSFKPGKVQ